jgi:hypothetical protein
MGDYDEGGGGDYANPFQDSAVVDAVNDDGAGYDGIGPGSAFYKGPAPAAAAQSAPSSGRYDHVPVVPFVLLWQRTHCSRLSASLSHSLCGWDRQRQEGRVCERV